MSDSAVILGVDGGGTKTRVVVADGGGQILTSVAGAPSALAGRSAEDAAGTIASLVAEALAAAGTPGVSPAVLCAGVAGAGRDAPRRALVRALQAHELAEDVIVATDAQVALSDAFGDGPGVLLIAGTGSIAFGRGPTGVEDRCGGWGGVAGDEGGGYWLGRRALSAVTASADGRESETALLGAVLTATQCDEPEDLVAWSANASVSDIAALAPVVLRVADQGDQRASTLSAMAAEELVLHVRTLARRLFLDERAALPVALTGGLLERRSLLRKLVEHRLRSAVPGATVLREEVDAARGAVRLARRRLGVGVA